MIRMCEDEGDGCVPVMRVVDDIVAIVSTIILLLVWSGKIRMFVW